MADPLGNSPTHRPWPVPPGQWVMAQRWLDLLFAHWSVSAETIRALLPPQLPLDTWEGMAWVGVVPFRMQGVRPRLFPAIPWLSAFLELNVRTYVKVLDLGVEKAAVYFFSLDAANPLAVTAARRFYQLPYYNAKMFLVEQAGTIYYRSRRTHRNAPPAEFVGSYRPIGELYRSKPGTLESWLTERYALCTTGRGGQVYIGEIDHLPWPLQPAIAEISTNTMAEANNINLLDIPPVLHFARRLDVVVWPLRPVDATLQSMTR